MKTFRNTMRTLAGLGTTAALAAGAGGCLGMDYNIYPLAEPVVNDYPLVGEAACLPEPEDGFVRVMGPGGEGGAAVELVEWGTRGSIDSLMSSAMGAPQAMRGAVVVNFTDRSTGYLAAGLPEHITPPPWGNIARFGEALLAVDVRRGNQSGNLDIGYGEELLVGAPGEVNEDDGGEGMLFVFRGNYDTVDIPSRYWELDTAYQPTGVPLNAEFGAAIAAPYNGGPGDYPDWIAVGAPGEDAVYVLEVHRNVSAASRFSLLQVLRPDPGYAGSRFGSALAVADLDGDGRQDLAVGAPDDVFGGHVFVFSGNPAGCGPVWVGQPLSGVGLRLASDLTGGSDEFGAALAVGKIFGVDMSRRGLVVGVPGEDGVDSNSGGICQFRIDTDGAACPRFAEGFIRCDDNPDAEIEARFGHAISVGDFVPLDNLGSYTGNYAKVDEIAVGRPYQSSDTVANSGVVSIYEPGDDGLDLDIHPEPLTSLLDYSGDQTDGRFGAALARGFVQDTPFEDLVIGGPGTGAAAATSHGSLTLTKAILQGADFPGSDLSGSYSGTDSWDHDVEARVFWAADELHVTVDVLDELEADGVTEAELTFEIRNDDDGALCALGVADFDGTVRGALDLPAVGWPVGTVDQDFAIYLGTFVGVDFYLEGTLYHDGVDTFTIVIDDTNTAFATLNAFNPGECHIVYPDEADGTPGDGFDFVMAEPFGCE